MAFRTVDTEVAIVGGGPTGATIANYLGMYGVDTVLIERSTGIIDYPRAVGMDDECLRSFQALGLADDLLPDVIQNVTLRFFDARGRCFASVRPATKEFGWSRRNIFLQQRCEQVLRAGLQRHRCVRFLPGHHVLSLDQDDGGAELSVLTPEGGRMRIRAGYVVGADGGRSTIRQLLGVAFDGGTHPRKWVVVECDNDPLDAPYTALHCDPGRPYVCVRLPHGYRRWEFMLFPGEDADEMLAPGKVHALLARHVADPGRLNIIRARVYTHHARDVLLQTATRVPGVKDWVSQTRFKPMPHYTDGVVVADGGGHSPAGRMFIQPLVETVDGRTIRLDEALGRWFAVVGYATDPAEHLSYEQRAFLAVLDTAYIKVVESRPGGAKRVTRNPGTTIVEDVEGHLREWFLRHTGRIAIIRPDRYVAALADENGAGPVIDRLRGILRPDSAGGAATAGVST